MSDLIKQFEAVLDANGILRGADVSGRAVHVWNDESIQARVILRPTTTEQVAAIMKICHAEHQTVVAHGGRTGLVQSTITTANDVILSLERMYQIEEVDEIGTSLAPTRWNRTLKHSVRRPAIGVTLAGRPSYASKIKEIRLCTDKTRAQNKLLRIPGASSLKWKTREEGVGRTND